jgi:hypothetical protein
MPSSKSLVQIQLESEETTRKSVQKYTEEITNGEMTVRILTLQLQEAVEAHDDPRTSMYDKVEYSVRIKALVVNISEAKEDILRYQELLTGITKVNNSLIVAEEIANAEKVKASLFSASTLTSDEVRKTRDLAVQNQVAMSNLSIMREEMTASTSTSRTASSLGVSADIVRLNEEDPMVKARALLGMRSVHTLPSLDRPPTSVPSPYPVAISS